MTTEPKSVVSCDTVTYSDGSAEFHLTLVGGRKVMIVWDLEASCGRLSMSLAGEDYVPCTSEQTGLCGDELEGYLDQAFEAANREPA